MPLVILTAGATDGAQSAQAQHQLNLLKEQQQRQQLELVAAAMQQQQGQDGSQGVTLSKEALLQQLQQQQVSFAEEGTLLFRPHKLCRFIPLISPSSSSITQYPGIRSPF